MKYTIIRIEKKEIDIIKISKKNRIKNINILFKINRKKIKREIRKNKEINDNKMRIKMAKS